MLSNSIHIQTPVGHSMPHATAGNQQHRPFYYLPQGGFMPSVYPPGLPQPPLSHLRHPHPQYAQSQTPLMMPNPCGQFQAYSTPMNPAHVANQQVPLDSAQTLAPRPQLAPTPKNRPNSHKSESDTDLDLGNSVRFSG